MKKVLVIDDDIITRKMIVKNVESLGYSAIQSSNGKHGWETLWENPDITLIVTDMMMPDMDGREFMQILRGNQSFHEVPVIIMSGVVQEDEVVDLLKLGKARFCPKPLNAPELSESISELLKH